ncbi:hypothetical protein V1514DRAFT_283708, partial [Lipomyces japonicus]|uniref:uncharacterized protein n=1 Tax=Lipomyces japonicus TaxID=56871 RepID=UPI0034CD2222
EERVDIPRRRAVIACEVCRARKSKCDGNQPKCRLCKELNAECVYRERGLKLDARDKLILDKLDHIEGLLQQSLSNQRSSSSPIVSPSSSKSSDITAKEYVFSIPEHHSTPWTNLVRNPKVSELLSNISTAPSPLHLETSRPSLQLNPNILLDLSHVQPFVNAFFENVNPFYAIVSPFSWSRYYRAALSHGFRSGPESVIILLVLALGEASMGTPLSLIQQGTTIPGLNFFASAWPLLPSIFISNTTLDSQALMLVTAFLFYLARPLEAWSILSATCLKLRAIIKITPPSEMEFEQKELFERVYWNALIFESDLLAELELPHSGIEQYENEIELPSGFIPLKEDSESLVPGNDDLWYFLAEISLRRLLNRVHHLLYPKANEKISIATYHPIVQELDFQLTQWYNSLPDAIQFSFQRKKLDNKFSTILRLRYFACQFIIWRLYIELVLQNIELLSDSRIQEGATKCVEACLRQVEHIEEHRDGHMSYLWQGSLSITATLLTLVAITTQPDLARRLLPYTTEKVAATIVKGIRFVQNLAHLAPSIAAASDVLCDVELQWLVTLKNLGVEVDASDKSHSSSGAIT